MVPEDKRAELVATFVRRMRFKGPVFEISALTREGCEGLVQAVYNQVKKQQATEVVVPVVDPRFTSDPSA
jgi:GTP-binding protein